jgi:hypothetical protein
MYIFILKYKKVINLKMERHEKRVYLDINYVFGSNCYLNLKNSVSFIEED